MKARYSIEAFAFAMIVFATNVETALIVGAVLVAGTVLGDFLAPKAGKAAAAVISMIATAAAIAFGLVFVGLAKADYVEACLAGLLVGKHVYDGVEEVEGNSLKENYIALVVMVLVAACRELLAKGAIMGYPVVESAAIASAYGKVSFGLIFAGMGIAAVDALLKREIRIDGLWVVIPALAVYALAAGSLVKGIVAAAVAVVLYAATRNRLVFSNTGKYFTSLPTELMTAGFLVMMLGIIA